MNTPHHRWLAEQLPLWERDGLITAESAEALRKRHVIDDSQPGLAQIVMGVIGALLIGTGLIAVIGYNWDDFSRPLRLLFAFLPLALTQGFSFIVLKKGDEVVAWVRETAALLQALATGACIALVSQIYNLGGTWPDFLFWWFLLSLPLTWVLRSHAVAIFYLISIAIWSVNQIEPGLAWHESPSLYPLLLLGLLPYWPWWPRKSDLPTSVRHVLCISAITGLCSLAVFVTYEPGKITSLSFETFTWLWTLTAAAFVLLPLSQAGVDEPTRMKPQIIWGSIWLLGYGVLATFADASKDILKGAGMGITLPWCWILIATVVAFAAVALKQRRWALLAIASVSLLPLLVVPFVNAESGVVLSTLVTLHLAAIGITLVVLAFTGRKSAPRLGAALLCVLILARMADSHFSLLTKGFIFIAVGVAFLSFNIYMSRVLRQKTIPSA
jgi:hypothetical protein